MELIPQGGGAGVGDDNVTWHLGGAPRVPNRGPRALRGLCAHTGGTAPGGCGGSSGWLGCPAYFHGESALWFPNMHGGVLIALTGRGVLSHGCLLAQFLQKQDSPGEVAALLCAAGAARAGFH